MENNPNNSKDIQSAKSRKTAFLELKYGPIHGWRPNIHVVSDAAVVIYEHYHDIVHVEQTSMRSNLDLVFHFANTDEFGSTTERFQKVFNLQSREEKRYNPNFKMRGINLHTKNSINEHIRRLKVFMIRVLKKHYPISQLVIFGERDLLIIEKAGVKMHGIDVFNLQKVVSQQTNYYFSLAKLAASLNFDIKGNEIRTNNGDHIIPYNPRNIYPDSAIFDAVRLFSVFYEFDAHHDNFIIKTALQLQKIEMAREKLQKEKKEN